MVTFEVKKAYPKKPSCKLEKINKKEMQKNLHQTMTLQFKNFHALLASKVIINIIYR